MMRGLVVASLVAGTDASTEAKNNNACERLNVFFLVGALSLGGLLAVLLVRWCGEKPRRTVVPVCETGATSRQALLESMTSPELREAMRLRGLRERGPKADLVARLMQDERSSELTNEACAALQFVSRQSRSRPGYLALHSDAWAWAWILKACEDQNSQETSEGPRHCVREPSRRGEKIT